MYSWKRGVEEMRRSKKTGCRYHLGEKAAKTKLTRQQRAKNPALQLWCRDVSQWARECGDKAAYAALRWLLCSIESTSSVDRAARVAFCVWRAIDDIALWKENFIYSLINCSAIRGIYLAADTL